MGTKIINGIKVTNKLPLKGDAILVEAANGSFSEQSAQKNYSVGDCYTMETRTVWVIEGANYGTIELRDMEGLKHTYYIRKNVTANVLEIDQRLEVVATGRNIVDVMRDFSEHCKVFIEG